MKVAALSTLDVYLMPPEDLVLHLVRKQWRQEQIAFEVGTSQATISRIYSRKYEKVRYSVIASLRALVLKIETEL